MLFEKIFGALRIESRKVKKIGTSVRNQINKIILNLSSKNIEFLFEQKCSEYRAREKKIVVFVASNGEHEN